ncbi:MAG TPA: hypothetical protein VFF04_02520 [Candidatus Babeliales bacterium]|nr:hypothetical protein [Candidatus Babeliales bacterium]
MKIVQKLCILLLCTPLFGRTIHISSQEATEIGRRIWHNECAGSIEKLTFWKEGEEFASLGIGHFIWFPANYKGPFKETFPALITFLHKHGVQLPKWLKHAPPCPWNSRDEFVKDLNSKRMNELRDILANTIELQTKFITQRLIHALPNMYKRISFHDKKHIEHQFYRVATSPLGVYALIDYLNFKGEGTNTAEQYNGQGWGLLQVLLAMKGKEKGPDALKEFAEQAKRLLSRRVKNSPAERNEQVWLPGWHNRINTYINS